MNAIGIYLLVSLGFVVAAMIEFALIILWNRAASVNIVEPKTIERTKSLFYSKMTESKKNPFGMNAIYFLDFLSFWRFLACYAIFNFIYWITFTGK